MRYGSPQDCNQAEQSNQHMHNRDRHHDRPHGIIGKIRPGEPIQDTGVLNNGGEQTEDTHDYETRPKDKDSMG